MKILVDMDNTILDFRKGLEDYIKKMNWETDFENGRKYQNLKNYFPDCSKSKASKRVHKTLSDKLFWKNLLIKPGAKRVIRDLYKKYDVYIVTVPYIHYLEGSMKAKTEWIKKNLPFIDPNKIIFEKEKWLIDADIMIEDSVKQMEKFRGITIKFEYEYNKDFKATHSVKTWNEVGNILL